MQARNSANIKIIDVSRHQGTIDWKKVATDGVKGVFIKATEGIGYTDPLFRANVQGALAAGLKVGFYHYCRPETGNTAVKEAESFLTAVAGLSAVLPHVLDVEGEAANFGATKLTDWCYNWLETVEQRSGHRAMVYTGASFAKTYLGAKLAKWPLWVAHYGVNQPMANPTWQRWSVFQYSSTGKVAGIVGNVDMNEMELAFWAELINPQKGDNPVNKQADEKTKVALEVLRSAGVIQTPEYWLQNAYDCGTVRGEYAALLIQNMARKLSVMQPDTPIPTPDPEPTPTPTPLPPSEKLDLAEIQKRTAAASVLIEVGSGGKPGSGVLLAGGYILTAKHVGAGVKSVKVRTKSNGTFTATLVAEHPSVDLTLYRIDAIGLPSLPVSVTSVTSGQKLLAVVHADGFGTVKSGNVDRASITTSIPPAPWKFDCSIAAKHGDSGGPAANEFGQLAGIIVQETSINVKIGSVWDNVDGCDAVNVAHPVVADWLKQYL
ncbi:GH25 family lysozyme [Brevibacillus centrosporus]|uniref:GH25 family lysozyme n=1 Tax=Brevibacillus centrosporus TaxID=54910 RepID=UPI002E1A2109|nr:GH25 family lysozyme [Brevibacillus centrosporus]MED1954138.1 GH25 family lysozyme [Brevibacillus centrosporus]